MSEALAPPPPQAAASRAEYCASCSVRLQGRGRVRFPCPECGHALGRCSRCRGQAISFQCPSCGFSGP